MSGFHLWASSLLLAATLLALVPVVPEPLRVLGLLLLLFWGPGVVIVPRTTFRDPAAYALLVLASSLGVNFTAALLSLYLLGFTPTSFWGMVLVLSAALRTLGRVVPTWGWKPAPADVPSPEAEQAKHE